MYKRTLNLAKLLKQKSLFLLGPRGTGKSFLIRHSLGKVARYDLLDMDVYKKFLRRPRQLGEELPANTKEVVIDEIQKIPALLDEVHRLIEERGIRFLLTGSSARRLRQKGVNLLAGRARDYRFFPLTLSEIHPDLRESDLLKLINRGGLPAIFDSDNVEKDLQTYVDLYLIEEIRNEGLVRKLDAFERFMTVMGLQNGKELHFQNIASDTEVPVRTLEGYLDILKDTMLGAIVPPFEKTKTRKAITRSKFYFFDLGVARKLAEISLIQPKSEAFGAAFEHFIFLEMRAGLHYLDFAAKINYWRTKNGFEVDFVVNDKYAIEVKATDHVQDRHLKGLQALREEKLLKRYIVVSREPVRRKVDGIEIIPWREFISDELKKLGW